MGENQQVLLMLRLIQLYKRYLSPLLPPACRFHPTCSDYAADAIREWGVGKGSSLALKRIMKCHPLHPGGFDYVPARSEKK